MKVYGGKSSHSGPISQAEARWLLGLDRPNPANAHQAPQGEEMTRLEDLRNHYLNAQTAGAKRVTMDMSDMSYLLARNAALERVAEAYRKFDEEMRNMRSADPTKVREALAALDAEGERE